MLVPIDAQVVDCVYGILFVCMACLPLLFLLHFSLWFHTCILQPVHSLLYTYLHSYTYSRPKLSTPYRHIYWRIDRSAARFTKCKCGRPRWHASLRALSAQPQRAPTTMTESTPSPYLREPWVPRATAADPPRGVSVGGWLDARFR